MTALERYATGNQAVDGATATWIDSTQLPQYYRNKDGTPNIADTIVGCSYAVALNTDPRVTLPDIFVINGRPGLMAEFQRALAARAGYDLEIVEATPTAATVRIRGGPAGEWRAVTVTMTQARAAGWTKNNLYQSMPERMLIARACTLAISLYAPGVKRGIDAGYHALGLPPDTETPPGGGASATLIDALAALDAARPDVFAHLQQRCRAHDVPNVRSVRFTQAHAEIVAAELIAVMIEVAAEADTVPPAVYDDAPESYDSEVGAERYDPDDQTRPFT